LVIPREVFPPAWMSKLLGKKVLEEVRERDRVLDLGTGCGTNAILAAPRSSNVVGVDVNQFAIDAAIKNAKRNGVGDRIKFLVGDLFSAVDGRFDLIIFDPPFRWFKPRDIRERAVADGNFETLTKFFSEVRDYLNPEGRVLVFYGDSGDMNYFSTLMRNSGLQDELIAKRYISKEGKKWGYYVFRLKKRSGRVKPTSACQS
jgi:release factor glutamine methyltransferase